jgi:hypothetical protein
MRNGQDLQIKFPASPFNEDLLNKTLYMLNTNCTAHTTSKSTSLYRLREVSRVPVVLYLKDERRTTLRFLHSTTVPGSFHVLTLNTLQLSFP